MAHIIEDRVLEQSITTGLGAFALAGAALGFRAFSSVCSVADTVWYYIEAIDSLGKPSGAYEYGIGTYSGANTLTRTTVRGSSNAGAKVDFAAGTKLVGIGALAPRSSSAKQWREAMGMFAAGPVSLKHYCVGDGATDDQAAIQAIVTAQEALGGPSRFIVDDGYTFLIGSTVTFTKRPIITGGGTIAVTDPSIAAFTFNINTTTINFPVIDGPLFVGPTTTNALSTALRFIGDATALLQHGTFRFSVNGFNAAVKDEKTARVTGFGLESMLNWNTWEIHVLSVGSVAYWGTQGSGTGNSWLLTGLTSNAAAPMLKFEGVGCVVGDIMARGHWGCQVAGGVGIEIGASTVYRAQIGLAGTQFDANCDVPVKLNSTGAVRYTNLNLRANNFGGNAALGASLQPLYNSIVEDRDFSEWMAGNAKTSNATVLTTTSCFDVALATVGACSMRIVACGVVGGVGSCVAVAEYDVREAGGALTLTGPYNNRSSGGAGALAISVTVSGVIATVKITHTASATGTAYNVSMSANGDGFKVTRL